MDRQRLQELLNGFPKLRIAVVGDFFLDKWLEIDRSLDELSVETNLIAYQVVAKRCYAGAAGTVLSNLAALETGKLYAIGFIGNDGEGYETQHILRDQGIDTSYLYPSDKVMTPTYTKPVFRTGNGLEETNRLDHRNTKLTPEDLEQKIIDAIWLSAPHVDAMIALDQLTAEGYGVITPRIRRELAKIADQYPDLVLYADSRAFIKHFRNMVIKCNNIEAIRLYNSADEKEIHKKAEDLNEVKKCLLQLSSDQGGRPVFVTCGAKGVLVKDENGSPVLVPGISLPAKTKIDIVGAGDACTSGIVTALGCGGSPQEAAFMGNLVASITIQVIGTTGTATRSQVFSAYDQYYS
ncbi:MAG: PfkB family carbohydrate kinase [Treponema sp.]|nr:PfkB family carbohydrate kinase [Treponema sp.]